MDTTSSARGEESSDLLDAPAIGSDGSARGFSSPDGTTPTGLPSGSSATMTAAAAALASGAPGSGPPSGPVSAAPSAPVSSESLAEAPLSARDAPGAGWSAVPSGAPTASAASGALGAPVPVALGAAGSWSRKHAAEVERRKAAEAEAELVARKIGREELERLYDIQRQRLERLAQAAAARERLSAAKAAKAGDDIPVAKGAELWAAVRAVVDAVNDCTPEASVPATSANDPVSREALKSLVSEASRLAV